MCFCNCEKADREEDTIVIPNRPVLQTSQRQSRIVPISPPSHSDHSHSTLPRPRSQLQSTDPCQSQSRKEIRQLNSSGRLVAVETITPRSSNPTVHQREPHRSAGSLSHNRGPVSPRHSNTLITPRRSEIVVVSPRHSGAISQGPPMTTRPPIRSRRQSAASYRSPRQSTASVRSVSYRSTREKMAEVDEGGVRRDYDRRDDSRR